MSPKTTNSLDFAKGIFKPHGHIEIVGEGQIITSHLTGPFNIEGLQAMHRARLSFLKSYQPKQPWAVIVVCHGSVLISPEGLTLHQQHLVESYSQFPMRPRAYAWVANGHVEGFDLMSPTYIANFAAVGIPMQAFHDPVLAEQWLLGLLSKEA